MGVLPALDRTPARQPAGPSETDQPTAESRRNQLLRHRHIWQASRLSREAEPNRIPTGHERLDELLGGWPGDGVTEILADRHGIGEVRTLLPALAQLSREQSRWVTWIGPPHIPYAPALEAAGMDISRVLIIHPKDHRDLLWATEQSLKSGTCSAVLCWPQIRLRGRDVQRFRMAARQGRTWNVLFRSLSEANVPSAADQRLMLRPAVDRLPGRPAQVASDNMVEMRVLKRRGGWSTDFFRLALNGDPRAFSLDHLHAQLERWRQQLQQRTQPPSSTTALRSSAGAPPSGSKAQPAAAPAQNWQVH